MNNLVAQYIGVALAVILAVAWIVRRIVRRRRCRKEGCNCSVPSHCEGCELAEHCRSRK